MRVLPRQLATIEEAHDALGLSYREIAQVLKANESTLHRWRSGEVEPSPVFLDRLEALQEFLTELRRTFKDADAAQRWLSREVPALDSQIPLQLLLEGRIERLTAGLIALNIGMTT